ncbi:hypothetical protein CTM83_09670 [Photobacterium leiognathi subsp. mandapamensis]|nr:hypothetical protein CTM83_09670 [Photobacterium leiognathi subsp. mandapamensis]
MMFNKLGMFVIDEANAMSSLWDGWNLDLQSLVFNKSWWLICRNSLIVALSRTKIRHYELALIILIFP